MEIMMAYLDKVKYIRMFVPTNVHDYIDTIIRYFSFVGKKAFFFFFKKKRFFFKVARR